ncbi:MAG: transglycosylase domain-containing protein [Hymenobacter sp.]
MGAVSANFLNLFGRMPNLKTLENPKSELASEVYSADGVLLGKYFRENRTPVDYKDLPQNVIDALIATEDVRFEEHSGIDFKSIMRVVGGAGQGRRRLHAHAAGGQGAVSDPRSDLNDGSLNGAGQAGAAHHQNQGVAARH